jgi:hypothetical protein
VPVFCQALSNFCKLNLSETHTLTLSLVRERASVSFSLVNSMGRTFKRQMVYRQSLVRESASISPSLAHSMHRTFVLENSLSTVSGSGGEYGRDKFINSGFPGWKPILLLPSLSLLESSGPQGQISLSE